MNEHGEISATKAVLSRLGVSKGKVVTFFNLRATPNTAYIQVHVSTAVRGGLMSSLTYGHQSRLVERSDL